MATPTRAQARSHQTRQRTIVAAAVLAIRQLFAQRAPLPTIVNTLGAYQFASATAATRSIAAMAGPGRTPVTVSSAFNGVSSAGFAVSEPVVATIDRIVPAPVEPLPQAWWDDASVFMEAVEQLVAVEVADAGRTASQVEFVARPEWTDYVRALTPPSCRRCVLLAGRIYRDLEAFERHPGGCDCVMIPVEDWESAHDEGYVLTPREAFDSGAIRDLTKAETQAITDGADVEAVIRSGNASGLRSPVVFGRRVKATSESTTERGRWRQLNPSRLVRLRPESIYAFAQDRDDAARLLRLYGYLR